MSICSFICAFCQMTCLLLPNEHSYLLKPKSIWSADKAQEKCSLVEQILHLDPVDVCIAFLFAPTLYMSIVIVVYSPWFSVSSLVSFSFLASLTRII